MFNKVKTQALNESTLIIILVLFIYLLSTIVIAQEKSNKEVIDDKPNKINKAQNIKMPNSPQATGDKVIIKDESGNALIEINDEGTFGSITLPDSTGAPAATVNKLYNVNGTLNFNGAALGSGGASKIDDLSDAKHDGYSLFLGEGSGLNNTANIMNTAVGFHALRSTTSGWNTAVGTFTLSSNTTGIENTGMGVRALVSNTAGNTNTAFGYETLHHNNTGYSNTAIGKMALFGNTVGHFNTAIGDSSLAGNYSGSRNTANGYSALASNWKGFNNTAIGAYSLYSNTDGWYNTSVGYEALYSNEIGNYNVAIGYQAGYIQTGSYNVSLGFKAGWGETGDNKLYIENSSSSIPLIGGDFAADEVYLNTKVGIGTNNIEGTLHIVDQGTTGPALFLEGASSSEGDITWPSNEILQIGTWNKANNTFAELMRIHSNGQVGIGTTSINYLLEVDGSAGKLGGGSWSNSSDIRLKDVIGNYKKGLAEIEKLRTIKYKYKKDNARNLPSENIEYGFVAQEVQKVFPEAINKGQDGYLDFNMHSINVAMVNAVQQLSFEKKVLEARVKKLEDNYKKLVSVFSGIKETKTAFNKLGQDQLEISVK